MVDTNCRYVSMCNRRSAQQESGAALSKNSMFTGEAICTICAFLVEAERDTKLDMWVGMNSDWHRKTLKRHCERAVFMFPGNYYTRCALNRSN